MHEIEMFVSNRILDKSLTSRVTNILVKNDIRSKKELTAKFDGLTKADIVYKCRIQFHSCGSKCAKEISNLVDIARNEKTPEDRSVTAELCEQLALAKDNLNSFKKIFDTTVKHYNENQCQQSAYKVLQAAQSLYIAYDRFTTLESLI